MKNKNLILRNTKYLSQFIKNNLLHNDYYTILGKLYRKAKGDEKNDIIGQILDAYNDFNSYFSIYTIMDTIEDYMQANPNYTNIDNVVNAEDFEIKDY